MVTEEEEVVENATKEVELNATKEVEVKNAKQQPQLEGFKKTRGATSRETRTLMKKNNGRKSSEVNQRAPLTSLDLALGRLCSTSQTT